MSRKKEAKNTSQKLEFRNKILQGDVLEVLRELPDNTFDTIITSPPYWSLRDYGVEGQIGLEKTLEEYLEKMLAVMKELKRVLKPTGVLFLNHGDCYGTGAGADKRPGIKQATNVGTIKKKPMLVKNNKPQYWYNPAGKMADKRPDYKAGKEGEDWQWGLRKGKEVKLSLWQAVRYWFDLDAVRVKWTDQRKADIERALKKHQGYKGKRSVFTAQGIKGQPVGDPVRGKNPGDVWRIPTHPFPEAHFATFPEKLIEPMILGSTPKEICKKCGKARVRISKVSYEIEGGKGKEKYDTKGESGGLESGACTPQSMKYGRAYRQSETIGWTDCGCNAGWDAGIVLDPFIGSGTVAVVAKRLGRNYCGIELSKDYIEIAKTRIRKTIRPLFKI